MNTTKDKAIKSFYSSYKEAHELIENEIKNIDNKLYRASRLVDRIIVVLFIKQEILYIKSDIFELINNIYDGELLSQKLSMFYDNPSRFLEYISKNGVSELDNIDEIENKIKVITSLFPIDEYERNIFIEDDIIKNIIKIFSKYSWKLDNLENSENNLSINPDILGSVFEKYINQRESGAYYTEIDTIKYISNNSVLLSLYNKLKYKEEVLGYINEYITQKDINQIEDLIVDNFNLIEVTHNIIDIMDSEVIIRDLIETLHSLKILDPTCGTGAFLVGVSDMIEELYSKLYSKLSELTDFNTPTKCQIIVDIIQNNLYGVDIMEDAVDIAKFRLYLKVLQYIKNEKNINLTNIKLNLKSGNSLVGSIENNEIMDLIAIAADENFSFNSNSFNWNEEFYQVINSGGFDCIIGNPPYLEYSKVKESYTVEHYITEKCKNIYAYVIERSINLLKRDGIIGFIVPISIVSTPRMKPLRRFIENNCNEIFYSNFGDRPGTLFNGVHQKLTILIAKKKNNNCQNHNIYTSQYYHWYNDERNQLFNNIKYIKNEHRNDDFYYKFGNRVQLSILNKINNIDKSIDDMINDVGEFDVYWNDRMTFWMKCFKEHKASNSFKKALFNSNDEAWIFIGIMNSSLYYLFWETISDVWHITKKELKLFKFNPELLSESQRKELVRLAKLLEDDLEKNKEYIGSKQVDYEYKHKKSKLIIDKIDAILAEYYNLTNEEYEYIIDYNLKYRMNDELETYLNKRNSYRNLTSEESHRMRVIDLFSGAGGFSEGFKKAGFDILAANEIDPMIAKTHSANHPETLMINIGIEEFADNIDGIVNDKLDEMEDTNRANEIRNNINNVDVIIGGPPCQGFSMAGARNRQSNSFMEDPRNYLFRHYFRVIQHFEPTYFIMENVQGLESMKGGEILREIMSLFEDENNFNNGRYYLSRKIISADELGVPQARKRLIIIGSKIENINIDEGIARVKERLNIPNAVTIEEAISDLNYLESGEGDFESDYRSEPLSEYQIARRANSYKLYNHIGPKHTAIALDRIKRIKQGQNWRDLEERDEIKSVYSGAYGRLEWKKQSPTITTRFDTPTTGRVIHPEQHRVLTPREVARIQSFDDSFVFYGNKTSIGKQIGNAVPPLVAEVLANIIKDDIEMKR